MVGNPRGECDLVRWIFLWAVFGFGVYTLCIWSCFPMIRRGRQGVPKSPRGGAGRAWGRGLLQNYGA